MQSGPCSLLGRLPQGRLLGAALLRSPMLPLLGFGAPGAKQIKHDVPRNRGLHHVVKTAGRDGPQPARPDAPNSPQQPPGQARTARTHGPLGGEQEAKPRCRRCPAAPLQARMGQQLNGAFMPCKPFLTPAPGSATVGPSQRHRMHQLMTVNSGGGGGRLLRAARAAAACRRAELGGPASSSSLSPSLSLSLNASSLIRYAASSASISSSSSSLPSSFSLCSPSPLAATAAVAARRRGR